MMTQQIKNNFRYLTLSLIAIIGGFFLFFCKKLELNNIPNFIKYNLNDGLWFLSGIWLLRSVWQENRRICKIYRLSFYILALFLELLQLTSIFPGTFDIFDMIYITVFYLLEEIISNNLNQQPRSKLCGCCSRKVLDSGYIPLVPPQASYATRAWVCTLRNESRSKI
jgi:hypothetical protein